MLRSVIDYVDCQLEPWKRPNRVSSGDEARGEGPQVREDSHVGQGPRRRAVLARSPFPD